jgi:hypothetical protein
VEREEQERRRRKKEDKEERRKKEVKQEGGGTPSKIARLEDGVARPLKQEAASQEQAKPRPSGLQVGLQNLLNTPGGGGGQSKGKVRVVCLEWNGEDEMG